MLIQPKDALLNSIKSGMMQMEVTEAVTLLAQSMKIGPTQEKDANQ